jgi:hypothetical protein
MNYDITNKAIKIFYDCLPHGDNFSDATYGLFKDDNKEMYENRRFLLEEGILEEYGPAGKLTLSKKGKHIWEKFGSIERYFEESEIQNKKQEILKQIERQKLIDDAKLSKWQARTFWWVFLFGLIGGLCGIISLGIQIKEKISKPNPKIENVQSKPTKHK